MKEANATLEVVDSDLGKIEAGTTLEVTGDHTNQFTDKRTLNVKATPLPENRVSGFQIMRTPDMTKDTWKEICVCGESETIVVSEK